jgi:RNA polymerase sigma-70 factor (ECF subfamily)
VESARALDAELCSHLDRGDQRGAGTWLVQRHAHQVLALCRAMVRDLETAEDLTQEVFERAFAGLPGFRREASSRTWLLTIARNLCIDHLRAQNREPSTGGRLEGSEPDEQADESPLPSELVARRRGLKTALDELAEVDRALVVLRYRHGLEHAELAAVFGLREGAVRMRLSRALARMRAALERAPEEPEVAERRAVRQPLAEEAARLRASRAPVGRPALSAPAPRPSTPEPSPGPRRTPPPAAQPASPAGPPPLSRPAPFAARRAPVSSEEVTPIPAAPRRVRYASDEVTPLPSASTERPEPAFFDEDDAVTPPIVPVDEAEPVTTLAVEARATPTPPPAPPHAMGQALELLDPGLPLGLFERLLDSVAAL